MLPTKFRIIWPSGFREEFLKSANQKQESPVVAMFVNGSGRKSTLYREPPIDASYQVSDHLAKRFFSQTALPKRTEIWWEAPIVYGRFCIKFPQSRMKGDDKSQSQTMV
jgi:hypothetical protein